MVAAKQNSFLPRLGVLFAILFSSYQLLSAQDWITAGTNDDQLLQSGKEPRATGAKRPTKKQWKWGEENLVKVKKVKLNELGLQRVNQERRRRGLRPLRKDRAVAAGQEVEALKEGESLDTTTSLMLAALPGGVDNSTLKYFPPIRSQGSLNSCAQFSAVYYTLTHMTAMARDWDAKNGGDSVRFSPKWTYNMVNGGNNVGSWHYDAYAIAQKHGLATWAEFPYDSNYRQWLLDPQGWLNAITRRAATSGKVTSLNTDDGLTKLKELLVNGYVLNFATYINSWTWSTIANDPTTAADDAFVGKRIVTGVGGTSGGHAMTIVGYNDDIWLDLNANGRVDTGEKGALRIANSWGTGWGEAGYAWVAYQAVRNRNTVNSSEGLFWYDEATWVTARSAYAPVLLAEFTLEHLKRSQFRISLGVSDLNATTPATTWYPNRVLSYAGGAYAFDGTTTARTGTFYFDLSDLAPKTAGTKRYYIIAQDSTDLDPLTVGDVKLIDLVNFKELSANQSAVTVDKSQSNFTVDYDFGTATIPPVAVADVSPIYGAVPLPINFDGSGSYDTDGTITSYAWNFGDGSASAAVSGTHTFTRAGSFPVTLTVTDNHGAQSSATTTVEVFDPNVLESPSSLTARASGSNVTLQWKDNSTNESGFTVERALEVKRSPLVYQVVQTVGANQISVVDTAAKGTYFYRVQAFNTQTGLTSGYSNSVKVRVR